MSCPHTSITPASGRTSPITDRSVVDLPLPLGPTSPKHDWAGTASDRSSRASVSPNHLTSPLMRSGAARGGAKAAPPDIRKVKPRSRRHGRASADVSRTIVNPLCRWWAPTIRFPTWRSSASGWRSSRACRDRMIDRLERVDPNASADEITAEYIEMTVWEALDSLRSPGAGEFFGRIDEPAPRAARSSGGTSAAATSRTTRTTLSSSTGGRRSRRRSTAPPRSTRSASCSAAGTRSPRAR